MALISLDRHQRCSSVFIEKPSSNHVALTEPITSKQRLPEPAMDDDELTPLAPVGASASGRRIVVWSLSRDVLAVMANGGSAKPIQRDPGRTINALDLANLVRNAIRPMRRRTRPSPQGRSVDGNPKELMADTPVGIGSSKISGARLMSDTAPRNQDALLAGHVAPARVGSVRAGERVWQVVKDGRNIACELHNELRLGAGWDVTIRQDGELSFSRRCADEGAARFVADALKQDQIK